MPRQFALLICCVFVWFLLKYDRRQAKDVSWVLWVPSVWMLIAATRSIDVWLGVSGGDRIEGGVCDPIFQVCLVCIGISVLKGRKLNWSFIAEQNIGLLILVGYKLFSMAWSDMPMRTFRSGTKECVAIIMSLLVLSEPLPRQAVESLLRRTAYILVPFSVLLIKYFPELGVGYSRWSGEVMWIGVTVHKSSLGQLSGICGLFLVWELVRNWREPNRMRHRGQTMAETVLLIMTLWLLKGPSIWASSVTSFIGLSAGLVTCLGILWLKSHRINLAAGACVMGVVSIIGFGAVSALVGGATIVGVTGSLGRDSTLTGRADIWAGILPYFLRQPVLGYGFGGFWTPARIFEQQVGQAHNGYLEVALAVGIVGLALTGLLLVSWTLKAHRTLGREIEWGSLSLGFLVMLATVNISESSIDSFGNPITAVALFASAVSMSSRKRCSRSEIPCSVWS